MRLRVLLSWLLLSAVAHAQTEESVPFELVQDIIVLRGSLNGRPATWLVDTGANQTFVTPDAARRSGQEGTRCSSLGAGGAATRDLAIVVVDPTPAHFMRTAGVSYDGILGTTYLERFRATFDYVAKRLVLAAPTAAALEGTRVSFERIHNLPFVEARVNRQAVRLLVDTGAQRVVLWPDTMRRLGIETRPDRSRSDVAWARVSSLEVGAARVEDLEVASHELEQARALKAEGVKFDGLLGYNFLAQFRVTIDYGQGAIAFGRPRVESPLTALPETDARPPLGLELWDARVEEVERRGLAECAGFKAGDVILSIDGQSVRFIEEIRAILDGAKPGATLRFTVRREKEKLTLSLVR